MKIRMMKNHLLIVSCMASLTNYARASDWVQTSCWTDESTSVCQRFGVGFIKKLNSCEVSHQRKFQEIRLTKIKNMHPNDSDFNGAKVERNRWEKIDCCRQTVDGSVVSKGGDPDKDFEIMELVCRKAGL